VATQTKLASGNWRFQVRRKGQYVSETFRRQRDGEEWVLDIERRIDRGEKFVVRARKDPKTIGDLIDLHMSDMAEVGKPALRSKRFTLEALKESLGKLKLNGLTRERLIKFGKDRAAAGAGPVTLGMDIGYLRTVVIHAAAVHGVGISAEPIDLARVALKRLELVGKGNERDRRPTKNEIARIVIYLNSNPRQLIPAGRIVLFAIASAMREEEICRIRWEDVDNETKTVLIRDRKDPRKKKGNHQRVPLLKIDDLDAWAILEEQRKYSHNAEQVFPYNGRSVGSAFRRACRALNIVDLHFHDLRHEATSRLFEAGFTIEQVPLVTGHKDWKMLRRYTHLRPEGLRAVSELLKASNVQPPLEAA
jgi:integrase